MIREGSMAHQYHVFLYLFLYLSVFPCFGQNVVMERIQKNDPDFYVASVNMISNCRIRVLLMNIGSGIDRKQYKKCGGEIIVRVFRDDSLWGEYSLSKIDPKLKLRKRGGRVVWYWDPLENPRFREIESTPFSLKVVLANNSEIKEGSDKNNIKTTRVQCESHYGRTPCGVRLDSISVPGVRKREIIYLSGQFGEEQGEKIVTMKEIGKKDGTLKLYNMEVLKWTGKRIHLVIPAGIRFGQYEIGIFCDKVSPFHSGWKTFWIGPREGGRQRLKKISE